MEKKPNEKITEFTNNMIKNSKLLKKRLPLIEKQFLKKRLINILNTLGFDLTKRLN